MHWKAFSLGFLAAFLLTASVAGWLIYRVEQAHITFPSKTFYDDKDSRPGSGFVMVSGILSGDGSPSNAWLEIACDRASAECEVLSVQEVRLGGLGVMADRFEWKVIRWDISQIVAESTPAKGQCNRVRLEIFRTQEESVYTRIPNEDANEDACKAFTRKVFSWKLADQPNT